MNLVNKAFMHCRFWWKLLAVIKDWYWKLCENVGGLTLLQYTMFISIPGNIRPNLVALDLLVRDHDSLFQSRPSLFQVLFDQQDRSPEPTVFNSSSMQGPIQHDANMSSPSESKIHIMSMYNILPFFKSADSMTSHGQIIGKMKKGEKLL